VLHFCGNSFLLLFGKKDRRACLPVEQPIKFELLVNLRTVKELGLDVAPSLLARVDDVIE
jgi:putative ABC transport system substrate-binding protein